MRGAVRLTVAPASNDAKPFGRPGRVGAPSPPPRLTSTARPPSPWRFPRAICQHRRSGQVDRGEAPVVPAEEYGIDVADLSSRSGLSERRVDYQLPMENASVRRREADGRGDLPDPVASGVDSRQARELSETYTLGKPRGAWSGD